MKFESAAPLVMFSLMAAFSARSQQPAPADTVAGRPHYQAVRLETDPVVDGDILNDPVWQAVPAIDELVQFQPNRSPLSRRYTESSKINVWLATTMLLLLPTWTWKVLAHERFSAPKMWR